MIQYWGALALAVLVLSADTASASFWGKFKNAFNDCEWSSSERAQAIQVEKSFTPKLPDHFSGTFSEADFQNKPWMMGFRYVVVVNRAAKGPGAQRMRIYEYGTKIHQAKVSTGREGFELRRKNMSCNGAPPKSYWSNTPTGYYTPKFLSRDHKSSSWDADMPFAIFYDVDNGLALHQVLWSYEKYLGGRASGGCTRQDPQTASYLFDLVKSTEGAVVPDINVDGTPVINGDGTVKMINRQFWTSKTSGKVTPFNTFGTLIIVEDTSKFN